MVKSGLFNVLHVEIRENVKLRILLSFSNVIKSIEHRFHVLQSI